MSNPVNQVVPIYRCIVKNAQAELVAGYLEYLFQKTGDENYKHFFDHAGTRYRFNTFSYSAKFVYKIDFFFFVYNPGNEQWEGHSSLAFTDCIELTNGNVEFAFYQLIDDPPYAQTILKQCREYLKQRYTIVEDEDEETIPTSSKNMLERRDKARLMEAQGLTDIEIAEELGVDPRTVYNYLRGKYSK